jgi:protein SCO1/2
MKQPPTKLTGGIALLLAVLLAGGASAADGARYTRDVITVEIPDVTLIDQRGDHVSFAEIMAADQPVLVEFIYATCTTICPVLSAGYASLQRKVDSLDDVDLISITIDPEHDGPAELREYLERYGAQPGWDFLTGTRKDIDRVMHAFDAWVPDKMSHRPIVFIRSPGDGSWVKLYGFPGSKDLFAEYQKALGEAP